MVGGKRGYTTDKAAYNESSGGFKRGGVTMLRFEKEESYESKKLKSFITL